MSYCGLAKADKVCSGYSLILTAVGAVYLPMVVQSTNSFEYLGCTSAGLHATACAPYKTSVGNTQQPKDYCIYISQTFRSCDDTVAQKCGRRFEHAALN
jgi:hypothetical protein